MGRTGRPVRVLLGRRTGAPEHVLAVTDDRAWVVLAADRREDGVWAVRVYGPMPRSRGQDPHAELAVTLQANPDVDGGWWMDLDRHITPHA